MVYKGITKSGKGFKIQFIVKKGKKAIYWSKHETKELAKEKLREYVYAAEGKKLRELINFFKKK